MRLPGRLAGPAVPAADTGVKCLAASVTGSRRAALSPRTCTWIRACLFLAGRRVAKGPVSQGGVAVSRFDVGMYAIRRRRDRRRPFEVRWRAAGRARSRSFLTRALAESYRAELVGAARLGLEFDPATGEPVLWAGPGPVAVTWYQHAVAYAAMKWPSLAAHSRASLAEALATVTPALTGPAPGRPPAAALRAGPRCTGMPSTRPGPRLPMRRPRGSWPGPRRRRCRSPGSLTRWCYARRWTPSRCG